MSTQYTGYLKSFGNAGFIAGINELKGMVEQANSPQGALDKLILALRIRTAFVKKIALEKITVTAEPKSIAQVSSQSKYEKELNLVLQS